MKHTKFLMELLPCQYSQGSCTCRPLASRNHDDNLNQSQCPSEIDKFFMEFFHIVLSLSLTLLLIGRQRLGFCYSCLEPPTNFCKTAATTAEATTPKTGSATESIFLGIVTCQQDEKGNTPVLHLLDLRRAFHLEV